MSGIISSAAIGAASLGYGIYKDAKQSSEAKKIDAANQRPVQPVDPAYQQNVNTAEQMARQGIPQTAYNNQVNSINQNQAGGIQAAGQSGRPGSIASIVRQGDSAMGQLNSQDAIQRNKNTLALIQQRGIKAGADQNAWNYNYADKYSENLAKSQALKGAAGQTEGNVINAAGGLVSGLGRYGSFNSGYANPQSGVQMRNGMTTSDYYNNNPELAGEFTDHG